MIFQLVKGDAGCGIEAGWSKFRKVFCVLRRLLHGGAALRRLGYLMGLSLRKGIGEVGCRELGNRCGASGMRRRLNRKVQSGWVEMARRCR